MPAPVLILAHDPSAQAAASRIADDLGALGYVVSRGGAQRRAAKVETAQKVVLLWSRAARGTPALRAAARLARAKGKLICVSLDAAPPPVGSETLRMPKERKAWRTILSNKTRARPQHPRVANPYVRTRKARRGPHMIVAPLRARQAATRGGSAGVRMLGALAAFGLLALAAGTEAYARDPSFAARLDDMARTAQAQAAALVERIAADKPS